MADSAHGATFPVLRNSLAVLRAFSSAEERLGVMELTERTGLHKSSVSRLLVALEEERLVERDPATRRYGLGLGIVQLAGPFLGSLDIRRTTRAFLSDLRDKTRESVALVQWTGDEAVVIEQESSPCEIAHNTPVGTRYGTTLSSSVQVFLAHEPDSAVRRRLAAELETFASESDRERFLDQLAEGRTQGVFRNYRRSAPDAVGLASPVYDHRGELVAAILLACPAFRTDEATVTLRAQQVRDAAQEASAFLGFSGDRATGSRE